jgi:hypothetical protein
LSAPEEDRDLEAIAVALRDDAPRPDPVFVQEMDRRVGQRFKKPRRVRLPRWRFGLMPALAAGAAVLIVAVVAVGLLGGDDKKPAQTPVTQAESAPPEPLPTPPLASSVGQSARKVERTADMTLAAPAGKLQDTADRIGEITDTRGGYVASSELSTGPQGSRSGRFVLRIPQRQLEAALADLDRLGHVMARSESAQDMTAPYNHVQARLGNLLVERRTTVELLRHAKGAKADRLHARLKTLNAEIRGLGGRMRDLRRRTFFTTVSVTLEEQQGGGSGIFGGGPGAALDDALAVLAGVLNVAIRLLPLALLGLLGWLGAGTLRRRRREAALF